MRGLTINLPFKIGQTVYTVCAWGVEKSEIIYYEIHEDVIYAYGDCETLISSTDNLYGSYDEAYKVWQEKYETLSTANMRTFFFSTSEQNSKK